MIKGEFRVDGASDEEKLEDASKRERRGGSDLRSIVGALPGIFVGILWGVYATHYGVRRETRLFIGAVLGGGTAKIVATLMSMMGSYSDGLWYFYSGRQHSSRCFRQSDRVLDGRGLERHTAVEG